MLDALQRALIGCATGAIVGWPKDVPVNKLASHVIIVPLTGPTPVEQIDVTVSAVTDLLDEAIARL